MHDSEEMAASAANALASGNGDCTVSALYMQSLIAERDEITKTMIRQNQVIEALRVALQKAHDEEGVCSCGDKCLLAGYR